MGTDVLAGFARWSEPEEILRLARVAAFHREPFDGEGSWCPTCPESRIGAWFSTRDRLESRRRTPERSRARPSRWEGAFRCRSRSTLRSRVSTGRGRRRVEARLFRTGQGPRGSHRGARQEGCRRPRLQPDRSDDDGRLLRAVHGRLGPAGPGDRGRHRREARPRAVRRGHAAGELDPDGLRRRRLPRLPGRGAEVLRARAALGRRGQRDGVFQRPSIRPSRSSKGSGALL